MRKYKRISLSKKDEVQLKKILGYKFYQYRVRLRHKKKMRKYRKSKYIVY